MTPITVTVDTAETADWTKKTWDLPPYMSPEFLQVVGDVEAFKKSAAYAHAVEAGLIHDDEWVGDYTASPALKGKMQERFR